MAFIQSNRTSVATLGIIKPDIDLFSGKSQSAVYGARPKTSRLQSALSLGKLLPKNIQQDKEMLYEENIKLRINRNDLLAEVSKLRAQIKVFGERNKNDELKYTKSKFSNNLQKQIREANAKIVEKDEEILFFRKKLKISRMSELEIERNTYQEECSRLMHHLQEICEKNQIPKSTIDLENIIYMRNREIFNLKKEIQEKAKSNTRLKEDLEKLKESFKSITNISPRHIIKQARPSSPCIECEKYKNLFEVYKLESQSKEQEFIKENDNLRSSHADLQTKFTLAENRLAEKFNTIKSLKSDLEKFQENEKKDEFNHLRSKSIKKNNPPKLFCRINQIIKSKCMFLDVFLSLLDKKHTGYIEPDELRKGIVYRGKVISKKYINEILTLTSCNSKIPIGLLEDWYEKYEFEPYYSSSSDEDVSPIKRNYKIPNIQTEFLNVSTENFSVLGSATRRDEQLNSPTILSAINRIGSIQDLEKRGIDEDMKNMKIKHHLILEKIRGKMRKSEEVFDNFIGYETDCHISTELFIGSIEALGIEYDNQFITDISKGLQICDLNFFRLLLRDDMSIIISLTGD